jgi:hypothetical protein
MAKRKAIAPRRSVAKRRAPVRSRGASRPDLARGLRARLSWAEEIARGFLLAGAVATAVGALLWQLWIQPRVEKMLAVERAATAQSIALIATAAATKDTATLAVFARYGTPLGPPGR